MESEFSENGPSWTGYYIEGRVVKEAGFVDNRIIDWIVPDN